MYRELKSISGTASCSTLYGSTHEVSMFPLIIEFIADVEKTLKRMVNLPTYKIGIEFERLQLYPFNSYTKKIKTPITAASTVIDYIAPIENIHGEKDDGTDCKLQPRNRKDKQKV